MQQPVTYGDIDYQVKKACVKGMTSQIKKKQDHEHQPAELDMHEQEEMCVLAYGQDTYQSMILGLMNGLPG